MTVRGAVQKAADPKHTLLELVKAQQPQFARALPRHVSADRFTRVALTTLRTNPRLMECSPQSVLGGLMQAAQLGVEVDGVRGQAYLVPRRVKGTPTAVFQLGYKGMIDLAGRGGVTVEAHEVCAADVFDFAYGLVPELHHRPALADRGPAVAYYAVARFADGRVPQFVVYGRQEMEQIRDRFASDGRADGPWAEHFDAMARKTSIRRLLTTLPLPVELADAVTADEGSYGDVDLTPADVVDAEVVGAEPAELAAGDGGAEP